MIIDRLFLKFAAAYGNTWRSIYKSNEFLIFTKNEWLDALNHYEESILYEALNQCREYYKFPPTLAEFMECCRNIQRKNSEFNRVKELPKCNPSVAEDNLRKIRLILNMPIKSQEK